MNDLRNQYLDRANGDRQNAAVALAWDLMQDDPSTLKAGYSLENAAIAASEYIGGVSREVVAHDLKARITVR